MKVTFALGDNEKVFELPDTYTELLKFFKNYEKLYNVKMKKFNKRHKRYMNNSRPKSKARAAQYYGEASGCASIMIECAKVVKEENPHLYERMQEDLPYFNPNNDNGQSSKKRQEAIEAIQKFADQAVELGKGGADFSGREDESTGPEVIEDATTNEFFQGKDRRDQGEAEIA